MQKARPNVGAKGKKWIAVVSMIRTLIRNPLLVGIAHPTQCPNY